MLSLYLASGSPRRRELLTQIDVPFNTIIAAIDETPHVNESPESYVERLACEKAQAGRNVLLKSIHPDLFCVLGADTAVVLEGRILGKPVDQADAMAMLKALSGREHDVLTAIAVIDSQLCETRVVRSRVKFRDISKQEASL